MSLNVAAFKVGVLAPEQEPQFARPEEAELSDNVYASSGVGSGTTGDAVALELAEREAREEGVAEAVELPVGVGVGSEEKVDAADQDTELVPLEEEVEVVVALLLVVGCEDRLAELVAIAEYDDDADPVADPVEVADEVAVAVGVGTGQDSWLMRGDRSGLPASLIPSPSVNMSSALYMTLAQSVGSSPAGDTSMRPTGTGSGCRELPKSKSKRSLCVEVGGEPTEEVRIIHCPLNVVRMFVRMQPDTDTEKVPGAETLVNEVHVGLATLLGA